MTTPPRRSPLVRFTMLGRPEARPRVSDLARRDFMRRLGWGLAAIPLVQAAAFSDSDVAAGPDAASTGDGERSATGPAAGRRR